MKDRKNFLGHLALWGTAFIWGTSFVILKEALDSIGTMWVLALRFIIAAALLLLAAGKRLKTLGRDGLRGGVLLGVCLAAAYIFQTYGVMGTSLEGNIENVRRKYMSETGDERITFIPLTMQDEDADGIVADWHPSPRTHSLVSQKVTAAIKETLGYK